jgi:hypothetical protein
MSWMSDPRVGWALAALALVAGYVGWGGRGLVLAVTVIAFWLLLQFNRALRVMRNASHAPIGSVPSAVMLHAKLKPGMALIEILPIAGSLGRLQPASGEPGDEHYVWQDAGGRALVAVLRKGRLLSWQLDAETAEGTEPEPGPTPGSTP